MTQIDADIYRSLTRPRRVGRLEGRLGRTLPFGADELLTGGWRFRSPAVLPDGLGIRFPTQRRPLCVSAFLLGRVGGLRVFVSSWLRRGGWVASASICVICGSYWVGGNSEFRIPNSKRRQSFRIKARACRSLVMPGKRSTRLCIATYTPPSSNLAARSASVTFCIASVSRNS